MLDHNISTKLMLDHNTSTRLMPIQTTTLIQQGYLLRLTLDQS